VTSSDAIAWELVGTSRLEGLVIDRYLLHHSRLLALPLLHFRTSEKRGGKVLLWFSERGKATQEDWAEIKGLIGQGYEVLSFDFRGLGEDRMPYSVASGDDPAISPREFDRAYMSTLSGVLANYVYNSLLTGRAYFLEMIEDAEIVSRFATERLRPAESYVAGKGDAYTVAWAISEVVPGVRLLSGAGQNTLRWSDLVEQKSETWPIWFLLPAGAYLR